MNMTDRRLHLTWREALTEQTQIKRKLQLFELDKYRILVIFLHKLTECFVNNLQRYEVLSLTATGDLSLFLFI